jgi:hypothetical protein
MRLSRAPARSVGETRSGWSNVCNGDSPLPGTRRTARHQRFKLKGRSAGLAGVLGRDAQWDAEASTLSQLAWLSLRCGTLSRSSSQIAKHSRCNRISRQSSPSILTVMISCGRMGVPHPSQVCLVPGPHDSCTEFSCGSRPSQSRRWMSCRISLASIWWSVSQDRTSRSRRVKAASATTGITGGRYAGCRVDAAADLELMFFQSSDRALALRPDDLTLQPAHLPTRPGSPSLSPAGSVSKPGRG